MTNREIDELIDGIYEGTITAYAIPESLYYMIARRLLDGLYEGYGATMATVETIDEAMLTALRTNVFQFSAAKSYQQLQVMSEKLAETKVFSEFKKEAEQVFDIYNKTWLKTEYDTAIGQAQNIVKWQEIDKTKEVLPYLRYSAIIDPNTSEICRPLDGIVAKVDDPIWQKIAPLNHFNCRCLLLQEWDAVETVGREQIAEQVEKDMQPLFKHNPYFTKQIFDKSHPYFQVPAEDREFARTNFGLPIPQLESIFTPSNTISEARTNILNIFDENLGIKGKSVGVSKDLTLADLNARSEQLFNLTKEYNTAFNKNSVPEIKFQSSGGAYGRVNYYEYKGTLERMNFGSRFDPSRAIEDRIRITQTGFSGYAKSKVDFDKLNLSTLTHEFGHVIAVSDIRTDFAGFKDFWDELKNIKKAYNTEINKLATIKDTAKLNELYLGDYARTDINEFLAEGFTEYKLKTNPSKYAIEIGKTIDKYFKK